MDTRAEVLRMLQEGMIASQIATTLGVSRQAVYKHVAALRKDGELPQTAPAERETKVVRKPPPGPNKGSFRPGDERAGPPLANRNAVITGEYETLWDAGLSDRERVAMRSAWQVPLMDQVHRQLGLLDVRIGRALERIRQTREALAMGVELQLDGRSDTDGTMAGQEMDMTTTRMVHTREILERQEKGLDRMLQRRERLLSIKMAAELKLKPPEDEEGAGLQVFMQIPEPVRQ